MKIKSGFVLEKVGTGYLAVAVGARAKDFAGLVRMNGTGAYFWELLSKNDMTREELLEKVLAEFEGVTEEQALSDIISFETKLRENGILVRHFTSKRICEFNRITIGTPEEMDTFINTVKGLII